MNFWDTLGDNYLGFGKENSHWDYSSYLMRFGIMLCFWRHGVLGSTIPYKRRKEKGMEITRRAGVGEEFSNFEL